LAALSCSPNCRYLLTTLSCSPNKLIYILAAFACHLEQLDIHMDNHFFSLEEEDIPIDSLLYLPKETNLCTALVYPPKQFNIHTDSPFPCPGLVKHNY